MRGRGAAQGKWAGVAGVVGGSAPKRLGSLELTKIGKK